MTIERAAEVIFAATTRFDGDAICVHLGQSYMVDGSAETAADERRIVMSMCEDIAKALSDAGLLAGGWRPIETAPRDGEVILIFTPNTYPNVTSAHWRDDVELEHWDAHGHRWHLDGHVTHWQPLPLPPAEGA